MKFRVFIGSDRVDCFKIVEIEAESAEKALEKITKGDFKEFGKIKRYFESEGVELGDIEVMP